MRLIYWTQKNDNGLIAVITQILSPRLRLGELNRKCREA
jgi:hypothetical protein